ncbi:MAG: CHASE3 domain-containing protein [Candidatus Melainabacteria bacterium]|nr:CHASE3 domain-containing protein [Candidatus Melainabacteria bacterium]
MKIRSQLKVVSIANALFVLILGGSALFGVLKLTEAHKSVSHSHRVLAEINMLLFNLADTTANERAYLITEQESYFQRYKFSMEKTEKSLGDLPALLTDNQEQSARIKEVDRVIMERLKSFEVTTELYRKGDKEGALNRVRLGKGQQYMLQISRMIEEVKQTELSLLEHRLQDLSRNIESLERTIIFGTLSAIACVSLFNAALGRNVVSWVELLRHAADNIERGRFDTRVPTETADEFAEIAEAFNRLGQSLEVALDIQPSELEDARDSLSRVAQTAYHVEEWSHTARDSARLAQSAINSALNGAGEMSLTAPVLMNRSMSSYESVRLINDTLSDLQERFAGLTDVSNELMVLCLNAETQDQETLTAASIKLWQSKLKEVSLKLREESNQSHRLLRKLESEGIRLLGEERDEHSSAQKISLAVEQLMLSLRSCAESINSAQNSINSMSELTSKNSTTVALGRGSLDRLFNDLERRKAKIRPVEALATSALATISDAKPDAAS